MVKADMHTHTTGSDSEATREDLLKLAKSEGLTHVAITNHDTMIDSYVDENDPVKVISGTELSCVDRKTNRLVHILCYRPNPSHQLDEIFKSMRGERNRAAIEMIERGKKRFPLLDYDGVMKLCEHGGVIYIQNILVRLVELGYDDNIFGDLYKEYYAKGKECYEQIKYTGLYDALEAVRQSKGVAVVAHPSDFDTVDCAAGLAKDGLIDGIELSHPRNKPRDVEILREVCDGYGLIATGGSDYHGAFTKKGIFGHYYTEKQELDRILER